VSVEAVYVVNLRGDAERWTSVRRMLEPWPFLRVQRIEAVYGSALPDDVCVRLTHDPYSVIAKGALGCALSHVRAWEIISGSEDPWALVIEDDATVHQADRLAVLDLPHGVDFSFCNHRTQPEAAESPPFAGDIAAHRPVAECLTAVESRRQAVGTDGYLISREGARKLVTLFKRHGYFSHVDLRMLAYATPAAAYEAELPDHSWLRNGILEIKRVTGAAPDVIATVLSPALTRHEAATETSRTREDRLGMIGGRAPGG